MTLLPHVPAAATARPEEQRILLIDRRTVKPALLVLALALLLSVVLPYVDSRTPYRHQVHRGDLAALADGITLVPTPGWQLATGALVGRARSPVGNTAATELVDGNVDLYVQAAPFAGTPGALLTRFDEINARLQHLRGRTSATTQRYAVTTRQGAVGVAQDFVGLTREGSIVAFVLRPGAQATTSPSRPREGIVVVISGTKGSISRRRDDIVAMIRSIRVAA
jgi:hypothetical protein